MDVTVKWGKHSDSYVRSNTSWKREGIQLVLDSRDAPTGVLHPPGTTITVLSKAQAKKLGAALIRVANSV